MLFNRIIHFIMQQRETSSKVNDIKEETIRNLNSRCECSLTTGLITDPEFLCPENDQTVVLFRAKLNGHAIQQIQDTLEEWLNETRSISISAINYDIDHYCGVIIDSKADQPCSYLTGATTVSTAVIGQGRSYNTAIIVGGAAGVLTVLILAVVCGVVICVIVCAKTKQQSSENLR